MREIRTLRVMWRGLGTELRYGLRHRCLAKAAGNCYSPDLRPPHQDPTLPRTPTELPAGLFVRNFRTFEDGTPSSGRRLSTRRHVLEGAVLLAFPRMISRRRQFQDA